MVEAFPGSLEISRQQPGIWHGAVLLAMCTCDAPHQSLRAFDVLPALLTDLLGGLVGRAEHWPGVSAGGGGRRFTVSL